MEEPEQYRMEPHKFGPLKGVPYPVCQRCGCVALKNLLTGFAIKMGCEWTIHPKYAWARVELVRKHREGNP